MSVKLEDTTVSQLKVGKIPSTFSANLLDKKIHLFQIQELFGTNMQALKNMIPSYNSSNGDLLRTISIIRGPLIRTTLLL
mmetsp:Transcript_7367/g.8564  ORF Transcript_7367/g.8564 Transcript_7367/m.8564 type:complete len:80 (-) Transcript_7367:347-586(-)